MSHLVVSADDVARRLRLPLPLAPDVQQRIEDAITDAQEEVALYLGRPLVAVEQTIVGVYPNERFALTDAKAWPGIYATVQERFRVVSYVVNAQDSDRFDVTVLVGLDVAGDPTLGPIKRFIMRAAAEGLRNDDLFTEVARVVSSVAAGGQSVSYQTGSSTDGASGGAPTLKSLNRWKKRAIFQQPMVARQPWPYAHRF